MQHIRIILTLTLLLAPPAALHALDATRPNIILFLIDDQDKASIGAYGGKTYTPNLDRMAAEGMKFSRAYVASAVCTPSRYAWVTGRYAGNSTSKLFNDACGGADQQGFPNFNMALEPDRMNLGSVLREAGYTTGWIGKFHLASAADFPEFYAGANGFKPVPRRGLKAGPEASALFAHNEQVLRRYITNLGFSWAKHVCEGNLEPPYNHHNPEWTIEAALEFMEQNRERPFYLHLCPTLLHGGANSWRKSMDFPLVSGAGELKTLPRVMTPRDELLKQIAAAGFEPGNEVTGEAWIDDAIGAVLRRLRELGLDDRTLVLFAPDHGRRGKGSLFTQDGVCIPMIARWPGHIPAGATCTELVQSVDWAPTVFAAAGVPQPAGCRMNGRSFLPQLLGHQGAPVRDHVYLEMGHARGIATKDWKYIAVRYPQEQIAVIQHASLERLPRVMSYIGNLGIGTRGAERAGFWDADQLYNLQTDPDERTNLAADPHYAAELKRLRELLTADLKTNGRPFGEFVPGGNAAPPGQIDKQIAQVKKLVIQGKTVIVPKDDEPEKPAAPHAESKRDKRKKKHATTSPKAN